MNEPQVVGSIDCCVIEASKENLQPLKKGRNVVQLAEALKNVTEKPFAMSEEYIKSNRDKFEANIHNYSGKDPLVPWLQYIGWTQETFVGGGKKSQLIPLLEKCTKAFQKDNIYKNDIRYLKVWITYADCIADPEDVFNFLTNNGIGLMLALFYQAWALVYQAKQKFGNAEKIISRGIEVGAQPIQSLKDMLHRIQMTSAKFILKQELDGKFEDQDNKIEGKYASTTSQQPKRQGLAARLETTTAAAIRPLINQAQPRTIEEQQQQRLLEIQQHNLFHQQQQISEQQRVVEQQRQAEEQKSHISKSSQTLKSATAPALSSTSLVKNNNFMVFDESSSAQQPSPSTISTSLSKMNNNVSSVSQSCLLSSASHAATTSTSNAIAIWNDLASEETKNQENTNVKTLWSAGGLQSQISNQNLKQVLSIDADTQVNNTHIFSSGINPPKKKSISVFVENIPASMKKSDIVISNSSQLRR
jgi:hypothetical protein